MSWSVIAGMLVVLGSVVVARIIQERAFRKLEPEQKVRVMDAFSGLRMYSMLPLFVLLGVFLVTLRYARHLLVELQAAFFVLLLVHMVVMHVLIRRRLAAAKLPPVYARRLLLSRHVAQIGLLLFIGAIAFRELFPAIFGG